MTWSLVAAKSIKKRWRKKIEINHYLFPVVWTFSSGEQWANLWNSPKVEKISSVPRFDQRKSFTSCYFGNAELVNILLASNCLWYWSLFLGDYFKSPNIRRMFNSVVLQNFLKARNKEEFQIFNCRNERQNTQA